MDDRAESGVLAEVLLVAGVVAAATLLFLLASGDDPQPPPAIGLNDDGAEVADTKTFTVAAAVGDGLVWGDVTPLLDGTRLTYSAALASDNTYCVSVAGGTCAANDPARPIAAGQQLKVHHAALAGKTLQLRQDEANAILYAKILGG